MSRSDKPSPDRGCSVSPKCVECPLERCRYEMGGGGLRAALNLTRDQSIRTSREKGKRTDEIAIGLGISKRTVYRALEDA